MSIQDSIVDALNASHQAHRRGLIALVASQDAQRAAEAELATLRADHARLSARVAELEARVAHFEAESVKRIEPEIVQPMLEWLRRAADEMESATTLFGLSETPATAVAEPADADPVPSSATHDPAEPEPAATADRSPSDEPPEPPAQDPMPEPAESGRRAWHFDGVSADTPFETGHAANGHAPERDTGDDRPFVTENGRILSANWV